MKHWEREVVNNIKGRLPGASEVAMPAAEMWDVIHVIDLLEARLAKRDALIDKLHGDVARLTKKAGA